MRINKTDKTIKFEELPNGSFFSVGRSIFFKVNNTCDFETVNAIVLSDQEGLCINNAYDFMFHEADIVNVCEISNEN